MNDTKWLSESELETWKLLSLTLALLPGALGSQLSRDSDLSLIEYSVLAGLSEQPENSMRVSGLATVAHAELSRLSHLLSRLERRGLVFRAPDPNDGRYTIASLTETGVARLREAAPDHVALVRSLVFDDLSEMEREGLHLALQKIWEKLRHYGVC